ncbi:MAG: hypothetical protein IJ877_05165 [Candidatus Gastranaerophilales bacterium]|nr:hypothetical protein [Candidatus Gastranaerophilales bacterium]
MKKLFITSLIMLAVGNIAFGATTAFDSMDKAVEVKLAPAITTTQNTAKTTSTATATTTAPASSNIQVQKFNNALVNLDDAQVELRQDLATVTAKYNNALIEKEKAIQNCKSLKKEIKAINKKMKNVDKSKKMINANLESAH